MKKIIDITGKVYGRLTVVEPVKRDNVRAKWLCRCTCGNHSEVRRDHLLQGRIRSCGCLGSESRLKHGGCGTPLYAVWASMKCRSKNTGTKRSKDYFDRGIMACDEWVKYAPFKEWALKNGFAAGLSIDRIDNDRGYSPENCRWATILEQANNKRTTRTVLFQNKEMPRADFCRMFNLKYGRVAHLQNYKKLTGEEILALDRNDLKQY